MAHLRTAALVTAALLVGAAPSAPAQPTPGHAVARVTSTVATVERVNPRLRELTLRSPDGSLFTVAVPEGATGLDQVRRGDRVTVSRQETIVVEPYDPTTAEAEHAARTVVPPEGNLPGGIEVRHSVGVGRVVAVDPDGHALTIRLPSGEERTIDLVELGYPSTLERLRPGDPVQVTYSEALSVAIAPSSP